MGAFSEPDPFEDLPPPYSSICSSQQHGGRHSPQHHPQTSETFDAIQHRIRDERHTHDIWNHRDGSATVTNRESGHTYLTVQVSNTHVSTEICVLKAGYQLAQARVSNHMHDFALYIGPEAEPSGNAWKLVTCHRGNMMHSDSYHFHIGAQRLALKKTHDSANANGISTFGNENWKLVDENSVGQMASTHRKQNDSVFCPKVIVGGSVMGVYVREHTGGVDERGGQEFRGRMDWRERFGEEVEVGALAVLMGIWEKKRRHA